MTVRLYSLTIEWIRQVLGLEPELLYINGPQTLPPPLAREEEEKLISRISTDPEAKKTLVERNLRLVVYIARKFESTNIGIEDLISIGTIGLMKAINTFRSDKQIKLATYASRCIENEILMFIRKSTPHRCELSLDEPLNIDWDGNELLLSDVLGTDGDLVSKDLEDQSDRELLKKALLRLKPRERQIIELRYGLDGKKELTQKEVADMLGISQSYISRLEKRILGFLRSALNS